MSLPPRIARLFHNYRPHLIDPEKHAAFVILTVLRDGDMDDIRWVFRKYGWDRVEEVVLSDVEGMRTLPHAVANLWSIAFWGRRLPYPSVHERWMPTRRIVPDR
ncbi:MAG: hypothetical protein KM310_10330 [Clostridiales bacterium]|nr:hypothetical protein [Clostridiales bacterium]